VASFLVIGLRGGVWEPGLLVAVPVVVCFFSYLFSVCVLLGLLTRSTVAALLLTLLFWFMVSMISQAEVTLLMFQSMEKHGASFQVEMHRVETGGGRTRAGKDSAAASEPAGGGMESARRMLHAVNTVLPKTRETIMLLERWLIRLAALPPKPADPEQRARQDAAVEIRDTLYQRSAFWILGTSLGFELVVLCCAAWIFCRRDF
jgi:hypothetical protein